MPNRFIDEALRRSQAGDPNAATIATIAVAVAIERHNATAERTLDDIDKAREFIETEPCGSYRITTFVEGNDAQVDWCGRRSGPCAYAGTHPARYEGNRPCAAGEVVATPVPLRAVETVSGCRHQRDCDWALADNGGLAGCSFDDCRDYSEDR